MTKPAKKKGNFKVSREEWLDLARKILIKSGIDAVKIERLANKLGVTRGGFYWFFKGRQELFDALLEDWKTTNTQPFFEAVANAGPDPMDQFNSVTRLYLREKDFSPAYDGAIRDWARTSPEARKAVEQIDEKRISLLTSIFEAMGYPRKEAFIRARVTYFHQIGYYAMGIKENKDTRERYLPLYTQILTGKT
mgnify:CR=1 FL=1